VTVLHDQKAGPLEAHYNLCKSKQNKVFVDILLSELKPGLWSWALLKISGARCL